MDKINFVVVYLHQIMIMHKEITVKEVESKKDLITFIRFSMKLYAQSPYFVPPILADEKDFWNPDKNPSLKQSAYSLALAYRGNEVVGRIAVLIRSDTPQEARFGWFDAINDQQVSDALFDFAKRFADENGAKSLEGPLGFSNLDQAGLLTFGFEEKATPIGLYNAPYYEDLVRQSGFSEEKEWVEFALKVPKALSEKVKKFNGLIQEKYKLKPIEFKNQKQLQTYVPEMFQLLEDTYKFLPTFTPLSQKQKDFYIRKYGKLLQPKYLTCIADEKGALIAFAITMPAYGQALQKANGRLFPFGWWHLLQATRKNDTANFYLIGIHPDYQKRGVTSIIFYEMFKKYTQMGIKFIETNPELADNKSIQALWQDYHPRLHKRRKTFKKEWA